MTIKIEQPTLSAMMVGGEVALDVRVVRAAGAVIGHLYGIAENPNLPNRPTNYIFEGADGAVWRESRLSEARDRLRKDYAASA